LWESPALCASVGLLPLYLCADDEILHPAIRTIAAVAAVAPDAVLASLVRGGLSSKFAPAYEAPSRVLPICAGTPDTNATQALRLSANALFKAADIVGAKAQYTRALEQLNLVDVLAATIFLNRGACSLKLGAYADAVRDCSVALVILDIDEEESEVTPGVRRELIVKACFRRASAHAKLGLKVSALTDLSVCVASNPSEQSFNALLREVRDVAAFAD